MLAKLAEYKPLAKIEEIEEQNYNMIDDRLNNGVEKFNREEEKKEQALLRQEYVASVKANLRHQLNNIDMMNADGSVENLGEKYGNKGATS